MGDSSSSVTLHQRWFDRVSSYVGRFSRGGIVIRSARQVLRNIVYHDVALRTSRALAQVMPARGSGCAGHVLVAPPGAGNVGDQAMVDSFLENVEGDITLICRGDRDFELRSKQDGVRVLALPGLIYGSAFGHFWAYRKFRRIVANSRSVSIVGADVMDGAYNFRASRNRLVVATLAARMGIDTRILGFSWNGDPDAEAAKLLVEAAASGVKLYLRDPVSFSRVRSQCGDGAVQCADIVFSALERDDRVFRKLGLNRENPYVLVNISAHIGSSFPQKDAYRACLQAISNAGLIPVVLPHVSRPGGDDVLEARVVVSGMESKNVVVVENVLRPDEVRALARDASAVVTGRMHLGVIALSQGTPAAIIGSQGKVEGLLQMFNLPELYVNPQAGLGVELARACDLLLAKIDSFSEMVIDSLPGIREMADRNFDGLN